MPQTETALAYTREYVSKLPADRQATILSFRTALDNHEPVPREEAWGYAVRYLNHAGEPAIVIWATDFGAVGSRQYNDLRKCNILADDGHSVTPYYVAGHSPDDEPDAVFFHGFPLDYNADGSRHIGGRGCPVNMSGWMLGPRKTYHLKVREIH